MVEADGTRRSKEGSGEVRGRRLDAGAACVDVVAPGSDRCVARRLSCDNGSGEGQRAWRRGYDA